MPFTAFADDQDLGPAIYLNSPPDQNQTTDEWDDDDGNSDAATVLSNNNANNVFYTQPSSAAPRAPVRTQVYGPTTKNDHIWGLAEKLRPNASITVQQMMIALQRANPNAFDQGNINALKNGQMLRIPPLNKILEIEPAIAKALVQRQNEQWQLQNSTIVLKTQTPINTKTTEAIIPNKVISTAPKVGVTNNTNEETGHKVPPTPETKLANNIVAVANNAPVPTKSESINAKPAITAANNIKATNIKPATKAETMTAKPAIAACPINTSNKPSPNAVNKSDNHTTTPLLVLPLANKLTPNIKTITKETRSAPITAIANNQTASNEKNLQQQLLTVQQSMQNYRQQMNGRLQQLEQQNAAMQTQLVNLKSQLANAKPSTISKVNILPVMQTSSPKTTSYLPNNKVAWWIIWSAAFLIVLLWLPSKKKKENDVAERQEPTLENSVDPDLQDIKDEYDFMNSQEAIPAKLDLARAYMDMDDFQSAEHVLQEVIEKGNATERKQAKKLLSEMKIK